MGFRPDEQDACPDTFLAVFFCTAVWARDFMSQTLGLWNSSR